MQLLCAVFWGSKGGRGRSEREGACRIICSMAGKQSGHHGHPAQGAWRGWCKARGGSVLAAAPVVAAVICFPPSHAAAQAKQSDDPDGTRTRLLLCLGHSGKRREMWQPWARCCVVRALIIPDTVHKLLCVVNGLLPRCEIVCQPKNTSHQKGCLSFKMWRSSKSALGSIASLVGDSSRLHGTAAVRIRGGRAFIV